MEPLIAVVLWGGIYAGARFGLREISVPSFTYLRMLLAAALLFALSSRAESAWSPRRLRTPLVGAGLAQAAFQTLLIAGLQRTTAGTSAILLAAAPLMAAGWLAVSGRAHLSVRRWVGLGMGMVGVALIVQGGGGGADWVHVSGDLLTLGAAGAWVWYSLAIGPLVGAVGTLRATGWAMAIAALVFTPIGLPSAVHMRWTAISWQAWAGLVYGATAGMVVAMSLWGKSAHRLGAGETMVYMYLEPVSAVVIAAILLGEALRPIQAVGALLTFAGVWLASESRATAPPGA